MKKNIGFILAGGIGSRFSADKPKQYHLIFGKEIISYSINAFKKAKLLDDFFVVLDAKEFNEKRIEEEYSIKTIIGGNTRNESFKNALEYIKQNYPDCEKIIENEAARPMVTADVVDKYLTLLDEYDFVNTTAKISDSLGCYDVSYIDREKYYLIQAPDAYRFKQLYECFDEKSPLSHPAHQLPKGVKECRYFDFGNNYKITFPWDIKIVEMMMKQRDENILK